MKATPKKIQALIAALQDLDDGPMLDIVEELRKEIHRISPQKSQPIDLVQWVPIEDVQPNDYNPNTVASKEMGLLYHSIKMDGYTQPIVTVFDEKIRKYIIVDGFHRYWVAKKQEDIREATNGLIPIVVLHKGMNDRMAATVRHNRARGEHSTKGMSSLVFHMLENGWKDSEICNHIGLEPEELLKLKHITGFSKLFENTHYSKAWETKKMLRYKKEYLEREKEDE